MNCLKRFAGRHKTPVTWVLRVAVGAVFIMSGISKMLDPWGFVFKIEEYLSAWGWDLPRTLDLMGALGLSAYEFVFGTLLMLGCYKRVTPWLLTLCMVFMLPLTLYIWIKDPVEDCGCFGDFWVLSNAATFWKNVVLTAMLVGLLYLNRKVRGLFHHNLQWIVMMALGFYIITIGLVSYTIQPLADFRPYPVGSSLTEGDDDDSEADDVRFVYERDGELREFGLDELPDDDDWTFVERRGGAVTVTPLSIFDPDTDEDVTEEVLSGDGPLLILVMSEPARADLSDTYAINELNEAISARGGRMIALLATGRDGIETWRDLSMGSYDCYMADDTQLKELVRGVMALVYAEDGEIVWKRTISSIDLNDVNSIVAGEKEFDSLRFNSRSFLTNLTATLLCFLTIVYLAQELVTALTRRRRKISFHETSLS